KAEDGIRDRNVTGVQTCALPIYSAKDKVTGVYNKTRDNFTEAAGKVWDKSKSVYNGTKKWFGETYEKAKTKVTGVYNQAKGKFRSEERRVGKECRSRRSRTQ